MGLQNLVVTMAGGYEEATEDIRALVASTLDEATQQDHAFVAGASQALANWTEKYQLAMSQGENQSLPRPTCSLGSGPASRSYPVTEDNLPNH